MCPDSSWLHLNTVQTKLTSARPATGAALSSPGSRRSGLLGQCAAAAAREEDTGRNPACVSTSAADLPQVKMIVR